MQVPCGASGAVQVLPVILNGPEATATELITRLELAGPVFFNVTVIGNDEVPTAWLPKESEVGESNVAGFGSAIPLRFTFVGEPESLEIMLKLSESAVSGLVLDTVIGA